MRSLRHHCCLTHSCGPPGRLSSVLRGACDIILVVFIMLLRSSVRPYKVILAALQADLNVTTLLSFIHALRCLRVIHTYALNSTTWRDCHHLRSQALATSLLSYNFLVILRHHSRSLRHLCGRLIYVSVPLAGLSPNNGGRTSSLQYYYSAFVVLTYY
jgi:hypothetical protein